MVLRAVHKELEALSLTREASIWLPNSALACCKAIFASVLAEVSEVPNSFERNSSIEWPPIRRCKASDPGGCLAVKPQPSRRLYQKRTRGPVLVRSGCIEVIKRMGDRRFADTRTRQAHRARGDHDASVSGPGVLSLL